jgi:hypothetical protein
VSSARACANASVPTIAAPIAARESVLVERNINTSSLIGLSNQVPGLVLR